jgi:hypothetical protein
MQIGHLLSLGTRFPFRILHFHTLAQRFGRLVCRNSYFGSPPVNMECLICATVTKPDRIVRLDCSHNHCRDCLSRNFFVALSSEPFRPACCCSGPIRPLILRYLVSWGLAKATDIQRYRQRLAEHEAVDRFYCHNPECRAFIPTALRTLRNGKCAKCLAKTCRLCEQKWHHGFCLAGQPTAAREQNHEVLFLSLARQHGWKRCPQCLSFVEKERWLQRYVVSNSAMRRRVTC